MNISSLAIADTYNFAKPTDSQIPITYNNICNLLSHSRRLTSSTLQCFSDQHFLVPMQLTSGSLIKTDIDFSRLINSYSHDDLVQITGHTRPTTTREQIIGEIRSWNLYAVNWDGENAAIPNHQCIKDAVSFVRLLPENIILPEPMLHASGKTGLFWEDGGLYADIEFLGNGRIAYYIERDGDKHKGELNFDSENLPPVFAVLLKS